MCRPKALAPWSHDAGSGTELTLMQPRHVVVLHRPRNSHAAPRATAMRQLEHIVQIVFTNLATKKGHCWSAPPSDRTAVGRFDERTEAEWLKVSRATKRVSSSLMCLELLKHDAVTSSYKLTPRTRWLVYRFQSYTEGAVMRVGH
jgi:hypothetical protein